MIPDSILQQADTKTVISIVSLLFGSGLLVKLLSLIRGKAPQPETLPRNTYRAVGGQFSQFVKFSVGEYIEIQRPPNRAIRITAQELTKHNYSYGESDAVVLDFCTGGGLVFGGRYTKHVSTNQYALPAKKHNDEVSFSAHFFHVTDQYTVFFRCIVDHLNTVASEVTLHVHYLEVAHHNSK